MAKQKRERVKNPYPRQQVKPLRERVKAGSPEARDALAPSPETPQRDAPAKKAAPGKQK